MAAADGGEALEDMTEQDGLALQARIMELSRIGSVSTAAASEQLRCLELQEEEAYKRVSLWLRERGAVQAAFRIGRASQGTSLLMRSVSGLSEACVELEGEYVGDNRFFSNFLSLHFGTTGSSITVSKRWFAYIPTLLRFLHSPQPVFVDQLMYQQVLENALVLHHCALYFMAGGEFFLEFFHLVHTRRHVLLSARELEGRESEAFSPDVQGECFDIYHLPLQGILMWLVALDVSGPEAVKVLHASGSLTTASSRAECHDSQDAARIDDALSSLFSPTNEYWSVVVHGSSGMGLGPQAEAEEQERRHEILRSLHQEATRLCAELRQAGVHELLRAGAEGADAKDGVCAEVARGGRGICTSLLSEEDAEAIAVIEQVFGRYLQGVSGFQELCEALGLVHGDFESLALAFCCGSADSLSLSSRQGFVSVLAAHCCGSMERLQEVLPSMSERVCAETVASEFWDWLFHALCTTSSPLAGNKYPGPCKRFRLYERPAVPVGAAAAALAAVAPCFGRPALLPPLVDFLLSKDVLVGPRPLSLSRDMWQMARVFLQRFPNMAALEYYDSGNGEFPSFYDSYVDHLRLKGPKL